MKPNLLMTIILPFFMVAPIKHNRFCDLAKILITDTAVSKQDNPYASIGDIPVPGNYSRIEVEKNSFGETSTTKPKIGPSNWNKDRR